MIPGGKQAPGLYAIVLSHYIISALCFFILAIMLLFSVQELSGHYFHPKLLALTHMAALGWGTLIIFGAAYQLIPVVFESELYSNRLPWAGLCTFVAGLVLLVFSFWVFDPGLLMQAGGLLLLTGMLLFSVNVFFTAAGNKKQPGIQQEFIVSSCIWLLATALLGVLLVFNFRYPFLPKDHLHFLKLHAHLGIAGWFLLLIIGVSSRLIPMFIVSRKQNEKLLKWCYYLINLALVLFITDTYISGINIKTYFIAAIMIAGIVLYLVYVVQCYRSRLRKQTDLPMFNTFLSLLLVAAPLIMVPFIIKFNLSGDPRAITWSTLYGTLLFIGWISCLVLGQTFKTLPFITWVKKYEHLAGRIKTPLPADLYSKRLLQLQSCAFIAFCLTFYTGMIIGMPALLYTGSICLLLTSAVYLVNLLLIITHKSQESNP